MAAGNIGPVVRANQKPRLVVLRGLTLQEPSMLTQCYAVSSGVTVWSGQLIEARWSSVRGRYEWVIYGQAPVSGLVADADPVPYFALQDSADTDVIASQGLTGLSSAGNFELRTPYFDAEDTYNQDLPVTVGDDGNIKLAATGDTVIGFVTRIRGAQSLRGQDSTFKVIQSASDEDVVTITTSYTKAAPAAGS